MSEISRMSVNTTDSSTGKHGIVCLDREDLILRISCHHTVTAIILTQDIHHGYMLVDCYIRKLLYIAEQGGMCMLKSEDDYDSYFEDTMKAGHYENDPKSVEVMIRSSVDIVNDLVKYGADFHREPDGSLSYTKEGITVFYDILCYDRYLFITGEIQFCI